MKGLLKLVAVVSVFMVSLPLWADDATYYTQHNFWFQKGRSITTNYATTTLIPINTKVKVLDIDGDELELLLVDMNIEVVVLLNEKHTNKSMKEIKARMLGNSEVDLKKYDEQTRAAIKAGTPIIGMSRDAVILARGYPPTHATPSLELDTWQYWQNKFNRMNVQFENGKVINVKD